MSDNPSGDGFAISVAQAIELSNGTSVGLFWVDPNCSISSSLSAIMFLRSASSSRFLLSSSWFRCLSSASSVLRLSAFPSVSVTRSVTWLFPPVISPLPAWMELQSLYL